VIWPWFWIIGAIIVYVAALSSVYLSRGLKMLSLQSRVALSFLVAVASSLVSLSLVSPSIGIPMPVAPEPAGISIGWISLCAIAWVLLVLIFGVALPVRLAPAIAVRGPARALTSIPFHFFVLPVGKVTARIAKSVAGGAASWLEKSSETELDTVFSREPSDALRSEPLASVVKEFSATTAGDIMVPRSAMVAVPSSSSLAECVGVFAARRFSRLPVYEGDVESVIGIVHVMDLLREVDLTKSVSKIVRPVSIVPESKSCDELLKEFQRSRSYMAIVLDEYGGTAGLVTVEDVLEELVGEMGHEEIPFRRIVHRVSEGLFVVHAQVELQKFEAATGVKLPRGDYETLAGYLLQEFGRIPEVGATMNRSGVLYEITDADSRKIKLVKVCLQAGEGH